MSFFSILRKLLFWDFILSGRRHCDCHSRSVFDDDSPCFPNSLDGLGGFNSMRRHDSYHDSFDDYCHGSCLHDYHDDYDNFGGYDSDDDW